MRGHRGGLRKGGGGWCKHHLFNSLFPAFLPFLPHSEGRPLSRRKDQYWQWMISDPTSSILGSRRSRCSRRTAGVHATPWPGVRRGHARGRGVRWSPSPTDRELGIVWAERLKLGAQKYDVSLRWSSNSGIHGGLVNDWFAHTLTLIWL